MNVNITQIHIVDDDVKFKDFRNFINSLRCPLCNSQLDGNLNALEARLYCVSNNNEYCSTWTSDDNFPLYEKIEHYYYPYEYSITINKCFDKYRTMINRYNMDVVPYYKLSTCKKIFDFFGDRILFFRKRMDEKTFLNKLKFYNIYS